jgi:histidine triad (HIT) family protein
MDCIFCKIAAHEAPATVELENDSVIAVKSINPAAKTHILIMPKKHVNTFLELGDEIIEMTKAAQELIKKKGIKEAYKIAFNGGRYQSVGHVHWHLLGGELENEQDVLNKT